MGFVRDTAAVTGWLAGCAELPVAGWDGPRGAVHQVCSVHAERFWLPVLGPTALLAARNLHRRVPEPGDSAVVSMGELAAELGVGSRSGRNAPLVRSLARLLTFGAASLDGSAFLVAAAWPEVPERHRSRFPPSLAAEVASSHPVPH